MPTATSSNSYSTRAEADAYFAERLNSTTWTGATTANREIALIEATRRLDEQILWYGLPASQDQPLQWPRSGMVGVLGESIEVTEIPTRLKQATAEMAMALLAGDRLSDSSTEGIESLTVGQLAVNFDTGSPPKRKVVPDIVFEMLSIFGSLRRGAARTGFVDLVRA